MPIGNPGIPRKKPSYCPNHPDRRTRARGVCEPCYRKYHWLNIDKKRLFQCKLIDHKRYKEMAKAQSNRCYLCNRKPPTGKRHEVDHDHSTGEIRKLLCRRCNMMVGYLEKTDDAVWLKLVKYGQIPQKLSGAFKSA